MASEKEPGQRLYDMLSEHLGDEWPWAATGDDVKVIYAAVEREITNDALRRAVEVASATAERHRDGASNCAAEGLRDAANLASYSARCIDDVAAEIRALIKEPGHD